MIGEPLRRREDPRLLRGRGRYAADIELPGMLHAAFVRSPHAHARIHSIQVPPGIVVLTGADLPEGMSLGVRTCDTPKLGRYVQPLLARGEVRYGGQPVAVVAAPSRYEAEDAAERLSVDYEVLPACVEPAEAPVADSLRFSRGDVAEAFTGAAAVVRGRFRTNRHSGVPLETRGLVAEPRDGRLTLYGVTKIAFANRTLLARMLGLEEERIRFVAGDVGGGFGVRGEPYPEDVLIPLLALRLGRPLKWIEDRQEHLRAINHSREAVCDAALALDCSGRFLALRAEIWYDGGAYVRPQGMLLPEYTAALLPGPYRYEAFELTAHLALTNKTPIGTFRGPGSYESCFVRERLIDLAARRVGLDPAEMRLRNLVPPEAMPYDTGIRVQGHPLVLEPSDYPAHLREVVATTGPAGPGRGLGLAVFAEKSTDMRWEYACVRLQPSGRLSVYSGAFAVGQGVETNLAQICAAALGVSCDNVDVICGESDLVPFGVGSFASRSTVLAGSAVYQAAVEVRRQSLTLAADCLEVRPEDLALSGGVVALRGVPGRRLTLADLAAAAGPPNGTGISAEVVYQGSAYVTSFGCHAAVVEADAATGKVHLVRYVAGHDVGRAVNPTTVRGQLSGAVAQALGGTLLEELRYDEAGQLAAGSLMDYLLPTATDVPRLDLLVWEDRSPTNPLGVKGAGELGIPGPPAAVSNAVAAVLGEGSEPLFGSLPLTPEAVHTAAVRAWKERS